MIKVVMKEINGALDSTMRHLDQEEGKTLKRDEGGKINKNKQEI